MTEKLEGPLDHVSRAMGPTRIQIGSLAATLDVWFLQIDVDADALGRLSQWLSEHEMVRAGAFVSTLHRDRYVAGRAGLRGVLAEYLGCPPSNLTFAYGPFGKPVLDMPRRKVHFNLAHSGIDAVIAVADGATVGVDIETIRPIADVRSLARDVFSPSERHELYAAPGPALAFLNGWTRKEAYLKAAGVGFSAPLREITVTLSDQAALISTPLPGHSPADWRLLNVPHPRCVVAVALGPPLLDPL